MADSNLDLAVRIRADLQNALQNFNRLEKRLGGAGLAADKARGRMRRLAVAGSSPLARGTPRWLPPIPLLDRFIPARAGNTAPTPRPSCPRAVHPRSRGEHKFSHRQSPSGPGSSPLARGTRAASPRGGGADRFIPARAGNTAIRDHSPRRRSVHPRSRGEHVAPAGASQA